MLEISDGLFADEVCYEDDATVSEDLNDRCSKLNGVNDVDGDLAEAALRHEPEESHLRKRFRIALRQKNNVDTES